MGWFTTSPSPSTSPPSTSTTPQPSKDGGYIAPTRSTRALCWDTRDAFFACLDRHDILDSVKEDAAAKKVCGPELQAFESACADSWVTYFKKRRVFEYQKQKTIETLERENKVEGAGDLRRR